MNTFLEKQHAKGATVYFDQLRKMSLMERIRQRGRMEQIVMRVHYIRNRPAKRILKSVRNNSKFLSGDIW